MRLPVPSPIVSPGKYLPPILIVLVIVCLWPFNFLEPNNVRWSAEGGLHFTGPGTAYTLAPPVKLSRLRTFSILLHVVADNPGEASWIASYGLDFDRFNFMMGLYSGLFVFEMRTASGRVNTRIRVPRPFEETREARIAIVYDGKRLSACLGGERKADTKLEGFDNSSWTAGSPLVFGSGANGKFPWHGTFRRFTVLDTSVSARALGNPDSLLATVTPVVDYRFEEGQGATVADRGVAPAAGLIIPSAYSPYTWSVLRTPKVYWLPYPLLTDSIANILAYIPIGFLLSALFSRRLTHRWAVLVTAVVVSFLLSLGIELLQVLLPSRWSTLLDVLTNTLGGGVGALLFERGWVGKAFTWLRIVFRNGESNATYSIR